MVLSAGKEIFRHPESIGIAIAFKISEHDIVD